jgi:hypothetical protein
MILGKQIGKTVEIENSIELACPKNHPDGKPIQFDDKFAQDRLV